MTVVAILASMTVLAVGPSPVKPSAASKAPTSARPASVKIAPASASAMASASGRCSIAIINLGSGNVRVDAQGACSTAPTTPQALVQLIASQLAASELLHLRVVWTFRNVPQPIRDVVTLGELMSDSQLYTDDDITRAPTALWRRARDGWDLGNKIEPMTVALAQGKFTAAYYEGDEVQAALSKWRRRDIDHAWGEDMGSALRYVGPAYQLIFPLNIAGNAALSLGNAADDPAYLPPEDTNEVGGWLEAQGNFGFHASADLTGANVSLAWEYDEKSLKRAVDADGYKLTAGLPLNFSFFLVHTSIAKEDYAEVITSNRYGGGQDAPAAKAWNAKSRLEVYVNGLQGPYYVYEVTHAGDGDRMLDLGGYDRPEKLYSYTRFDCRLVKIETAKAR
jgi:Fe-S cluster biogenesis protein NfuA